MSNARKKFGDWGESVAATYLEAHDHKILARNWRCIYGEMDLVAQTASHLAFVEVKTRRGRGKGAPEEAITSRKAQKLITVAQMYLADQDLDDVAWQIDLMAVEIDSSGKLIRCEHIPNIVTG